MRTFIAVELSKGTISELKRVISELNISGANIKWIKPDTLHLTLKFLGDIPEEMVPVISRKLKQLAEETDPFDLSIKGIGVFPEWRNARVIWVGIEKGAEELSALASRVEEAMASAGFPRDKRKFLPHITVGRMRSAKNMDKLQETARALEVEEISTPIAALTFFRSELTRTGAIHTPIEIVDFS